MQRRIVPCDCNRHMFPACAHGLCMLTKSGTCSNCRLKRDQVDIQTGSNSDLILTPVMRPVSSAIPFITFSLSPVGSQGSITKKAAVQFWQILPIATSTTRGFPWGHFENF